MPTQRGSSVNRTTTWNSKKRYKVNESENYKGNTYLNVTGFNSEPGVGNDWIIINGFDNTLFVKKRDSLSTDSDISGANAIVSLPANGSNYIVLTNDLLTSVAGFDTTLIDGVPGAEVPYEQKEFFFQNNTGNDITIIHEKPLEDKPFSTASGVDLVVPNRGVIFCKFQEFGMKQLFQSWSSGGAIPDASETESGIVNLITQTFKGNKTIKGESSVTGNALEITNSSGEKIIGFSNKKSINLPNGFVFEMSRTTINPSDSPRFRFFGPNITQQEIYAEQDSIVFTGGISISESFKTKKINFSNNHGTASSPNIIAENGIKGGIYLYSNGGFNTNIGFSTNNNANVAATQKMLLHSSGALIIGVATTPDASSSLQVDSTTRGSLPFPRMTSAQRTAISSPAIGLHVYQTDGVEGVYVNKSTGWAFAY